jgi:indole-3-glycerol phosphate synthase
VLLIVAILEDVLLRELLAVAVESGLDVLVEAHTAAEVERAVAARATLIGINNRDLRTFVTTLETAEELGQLVPASALRIAESGIETRDHIHRLASAGFQAFLVGESLMRAADPAARLRELHGRVAVRR